MNLREQLRLVEDELRSIHEAAGDEPLNDEQQPRWDELTAQRSTLQESIRRDDERRATAAGLATAGRPGGTERGDSGAEAASSPTSPEVMRRVEPFDGREVRSLTRTEARDRALKVLETKDHTRHLRDESIEKAERALRTQTPDCDGAYIGRLMLMTERDDYRNAWQKLVTMPNPVLTSDEARAVQEVQEFRAMSGGTDASGGFGVPVNLAA